MKAFTRTMLVVGIAYLISVAAMLIVLANRDRAFQSTRPTLQGTVIAVAPREEGNLRSVFRSRGTRLVTVRYTIDGQQRTTQTEVDADYQVPVGSTLTLVRYQLGSEPSPDDPVEVRGQSLRALEALPMLFLVGAGVVTWYLVFSVLQDRGRRPRRPRAAVGTDAASATG